MACKSFACEKFWPYLKNKQNGHYSRLYIAFLIIQKQPNNRALNAVITLAFIIVVISAPCL